MFGVMEYQLNDVIKVSSAVMTFCVLVFTAFKSFSQYQIQWSRRFHKKLQDLRSDEHIQGPLTHYLDRELYLESYRIATGIRANKMKVDLLARLALTGRWSSYQIKGVAKFLVTTADRPVPKLCISRWQAANALLSLSFGVLSVVVGVLLGVAKLWEGLTSTGFDSALAFAVAPVLVVTYILVAVLVLSYFNYYTAARQFCTFLEKYPDEFPELGWPKRSGQKEG